MQLDVIQVPDSEIFFLLSAHQFKSVFLFKFRTISDSFFILLLNLNRLEFGVHTVKVAVVFSFQLEKVDGLDGVEHFFKACVVD